MDKIKFDGDGQIFCALEEVFNIFIIVRAKDIVQTDIFRKKILENLPFYIKKHRLIFYSSNISKQAFVRQIEPVVYVEYDDRKFVDTIYPFVSVIFAAELPIVSASQKSNGHILLQLNHLSNIVDVDLNDVM